MKLQAATFLDLLRVKQWIKNLLIYIALIFTNNLFNAGLFLRVTAGFFLLCFAASAIYILNDIIDRKEDAYHPDKKSRPIAKGSVSVPFASAISAILAVSALAGSFLISRDFFYVICVYLAMNILYTLKLKHAVILDIFIVAAGYVLRAIAGAVIISVAISPWLLICTSLLALFVIMAKRRHEVSTLSDAARHRKILSEYSVPLLDEMTSVVTASTVIAYSLYTFTSETAARHNYLMLTIPFVLYGIFRYLYLVHKKNMGGSPETVFLRDIPTIVNILLWLSATISIVYFFK
ncbi:MAG TPA: decaprenyl-phosphate phosphoribosyltransferase [Candidatus Goldiibacteriota bacterium]|nr:decaprenyl-phosphate phosphoribosyltransferase [Candidatus Goldiibacteriota bacterium]